jgi:hypothetical protein
MSMKNSNDTIGIRTETFWFVAQCLNHLRPYLKVQKIFCFIFCTFRPIRMTSSTKGAHTVPLLMIGFVKIDQLKTMVS